MTRHLFGWSLPPGVTDRMIDEAAGGSGGPCDVCGLPDDDGCICPECPICGAWGDRYCYEVHGLVRSLGQTVSRANWEAECDRYEAEARAAEEAWWDKEARRQQEELS